MNIRDICFAYFGWFGEKLSGLLKGTEHDLDAAYMKVHPDVYFSYVGFAAFLTAGALVILCSPLAGSCTSPLWPSSL
jgi:hypothetical protein